MNEIKTALFLACSELGANNSLWSSNNVLFKTSNEFIVSINEHDGKYITVIITDTTVSHKYEMDTIFPNDETTQTQFDKVVRYIDHVWNKKYTEEDVYANLK